MSRALSHSKLKILPLTPSRWPDLEKLFGPRGACGGCWCMFWRVRRSIFEKNKGAGNRRAFRKIVRGGRVPGLLAYAGKEPVGWCAVEPREAYAVLERSRVLARVDEQPVWSVVCFFIAKAYRRRGVTRALLEAACAYAKKRGAKILEGYPTEPRKGAMPDPFVWTGLASAFRKAGFKEVARRSPTRPLMRRLL